MSEGDIGVPKKLNRQALKHIKRRRAPPRIVSITEGMGVESKVRGKKKPPRVPKDKEQFDSTLRPRLIRLIKLSDEPIRTTPISIRTTLKTSIDSNSMRKISIPRVRPRAGLHLNARVKRIAPVIGSSSRVVKAPSQLKSRAVKRQMRDDLLGAGCILKPGTVHVWRLFGSQRSRVGKGSEATIELSGDQGVRISFHSRSGDVIQDVEMVAGKGKMHIPVPPTSAYFSAWGLGGASLLPSTVPPAPGALTSEVSTHNSTSIGFQSDSIIIQLNETHYLCRGGTIRANVIKAGKPQSRDNFCFPAREVLEGQRIVVMTAPASMDTLLVIVEGEGDLQDSVRVSCSGTELTSSMDPLVQNGRMAILLSLRDLENVQDLTRLAIRTSEGSRVHSVVCFKGEVEHWVKTLQSRDWDGLVEEGPLSSEGTATLRWLPTPSQLDESTLKKRKSRGMFDLGEQELENVRRHIESGTSFKLEDLGSYKEKVASGFNESVEDKSSRLVRQAEDYAGPGMGSHFPSHKGSEVVVTHEEGDPDRPIIIGQVPNPETATSTTDMVHQTTLVSDQQSTSSPTETKRKRWRLWGGRK